MEVFANGLAVQDGFKGVAGGFSATLLKKPLNVISGRILGSNTRDVLG